MQMEQEQVDFCENPVYFYGEVRYSHAWAGVGFKNGRWAFEFDPIKNYWIFCVEEIEQENKRKRAKNDPNCSISASTSGEFKRLCKFPLHEATAIRYRPPTGTVFTIAFDNCSADIISNNQDDLKKIYELVQTTCILKDTTIEAESHAKIFNDNRIVTNSNSSSVKSRSKKLSSAPKAPFDSSKWENELPCKIVASNNIKDGAYDSVVVVAYSPESILARLPTLAKAINSRIEVDANTFDGGNCAIINVEQSVIPSGRLILSPTGSLNRDYDDVRRYIDAAVLGTRKALKSGSKKILLAIIPYANFPQAKLVSILAALQVLHVPLEVREISETKKRKAKVLGVWFAEKEPNADQLLLQAVAIETGRHVARDIGGSDPERMAPPKVAEYIYDHFANSSIKVDIMDDQTAIQNEYPLVGAVNRAANVSQRHQARVIKLAYQGAGPIQETLMFVGKGVTLDTGGLDLKTGGSMIGMSRDKSGAAAVAGFFKVLDVLQPKGIKVVGILPTVRNSIGYDGYACDEILTARSGRRVRVVNTDAEGRMILLDPLCELKEMALKEVNPHLFTVATLTGHARLTVGTGYSIALDNGPARSVNFSESLRQSSEAVGEIIEVSLLRREDYNFHRGETEYEDLRQSGKRPSSGTTRGHMTPCAFLIMSSGLDEHGIDSKSPLKYTHIDIAGAEPEFPNVPWGSPIAALANRFILSRR